MAAHAKLVPYRMTVAEFLAWPGDDSGLKFELVDGEPRAMDPASVTHGVIQANIGGLLRAHLTGTRCKAVAAPGVVPRLRENMNMRVPDIAVNCVPDEAGQRALLDPVVIIEILSPSNERETRENVWAYPTIPSVREIVLVQSTSLTAEVLRRGPDGNWPGQPLIAGPNDEIVLESIDLRAPLREFYTDTYLTRPGHP